MTDVLEEAARIQAILERRASVLAQAPQAEEPGESIELVVVALGAELYGIDILQVQAIQMLVGLTPVPGLPACWAGLVNLRGRLYPVLSLRRYLALVEPAGAASTGKVVLATAAKLTVALWVDDVLEVRRVPLAQIGAPLADADAQARRGAGVRGITPDLLLVLDLEALLGDPRLVVQGQSN